MPFFLNKLVKIFLQILVFYFLSFYKQSYNFAPLPILTSLIPQSIMESYPNKLILSKIEFIFYIYC